MVTKATYKYRFKVNGKVVYCGITSDLERREREQRWIPAAGIRHLWQRAMSLLHALFDLGRQSKALRPYIKVLINAIRMLSPAVAVSVTSHLSMEDSRS